MQQRSSIRSRFAVTVLANVTRAGLGFLAGLLLARGLGPEGYGRYAFLVASFAALAALLDVGSVSAFYTFLSQGKRSKRFVGAYLGWQISLVLAVLVVLGLLVPRGLVDRVWQGQGIGLVLLAFIAVFLQTQLWQGVTAVAEAQRLTNRAQAITVLVAVVHLTIVVALWATGSLSVERVFLAIAGEYVLAVIVAWGLIWRPLAAQGAFEEPSPVPETRQTFERYLSYCSPLVVFTIAAFFYNFWNRWVLQYFGGSEQQAYFAVGLQFSAVALLATTSILRILWKEIAEAQELEDVERVTILYRKTSRMLFMVGAVLSSFLIPWSEEIVRHLLGDGYLAAVPVLAVMLLYPVHQSLGQITATLFYATSNTRLYTLTSVTTVAFSVVIGYFVLAPPEARIPGLGLGALGLAVQMVLVQLCSVNVVLYLASRVYGWRFDWTYQVVGLGGALLSGWLAYQVPALLTENLALRLACAVGLYGLAIAAMIRYVPWVAGMDGSEVVGLLRRLGWGRG